MTRPTVAVAGAGAAGLMAAIHAARAGADAVLIERTADGGRKILISGGGRCNVLPGRAQPERYVTASSHNTLRRILRSWPLAEQRAFFENELAMAMVLEEDTGKLFPESNRARDVRDGLVAAARGAGARLWFGTRVIDVMPVAGRASHPDGARDLAAGSASHPDSDGSPDAGSRAGRWRVRIDSGDGGIVDHDFDAVILATGGLSVPQTGSDGIGLRIARALGHTLNETYPALTPLTARPPVHAELAGISPVVHIEAPGAKPRFATTDGFLFTHRGWSGPSVLDASHLAVRSALAGERQEIVVRWVPSLDRNAWDALLRQEGAGTVAGLLDQHLPNRLARQLLAEANVPADRRRAQLRRDERQRLLLALAEYPLPWTGDEGYRKAEVTGGGIALNEVDPATMESRLRPGLFLCGEMLDAFGPIGGHNFLWAWATGRAAGLGAAAGQAAD
jgi:predicted flavoprotein YhiN